MELDNIQVVEYSVKQGAYHRHSLSDMLFKNQKNVFEERSIDYVPIGFFKTVDEADNFIEWHRLKIESYKRSTAFLVNKTGSLVYVQKPS